MFLSAILTVLTVKKLLPVPTSCHNLRKIFENEMFHSTNKWYYMVNVEQLRLIDNLLVFMKTLPNILCNMSR